MTAAADALAAPSPPRPVPLPVWTAGWLAAWLATFGVYMLAIVPTGGGTFGRSWIGGLHFALSVALMAWVYRRHYPGRAALAEFGRGHAVALAVSLALLIAGYAAAAAWWPLSAETWEQARVSNLGLLRMDATYLVYKLPELVFQQSMIYVLTRALVARGFAGPRLLGAFLLVFGAVHVPAVAIKGWVAVPFVLAAGTAGVTFPLLITRLRGGIVYSFCAHLLAYVAVGVALRATL